MALERRSTFCDDDLKLAIALRNLAEKVKGSIGMPKCQDHLVGVHVLHRLVRNLQARRKQHFTSALAGSKPAFSFHGASLESEAQLVAASATRAWK